jgi:hypothetical protein
LAGAKRMSGMHLVAGIAQRSNGVGKRRAKAFCLGVVAGGLLITGFGPGVPSATAAAGAREAASPIESTAVPIRDADQRVQGRHGPAREEGRRPDFDGRRLPR